jgi:CO/xanthine dehydrogenase FAD-binding subunit
MSEVFFPSTLEEVYDIRKQSPDSMVLAGGTDLLVRMRNSERKTSVLIGLEKIPALSRISIDHDFIRIGATTTHQSLLDSSLIQTYFPLLHQALLVLGSPPIRHMGTIGGNICTASPAGDTLPPLYVLEAELELSSRDGTRVVPIREFITGPGKTVMNNHEILTSIRIRMPDPSRRGWYLKVGQRRALAISIVSMAVLIKMNPDRTIQDARFAFGSVGPTVVRFLDLERSLAGAVPGFDELSRFGMNIAERIQPISDIRASASYRKMVAKGLPLKILDGVPFI